MVGVLEPDAESASRLACAAESASTGGALPDIDAQMTAAASERATAAAEAMDLRVSSGFIGWFPDPSSRAFPLREGSEFSVSTVASSGVVSSQ